MKRFISVLLVVLCSISLKAQITSVTPAPQFLTVCENCSDTVNVLLGGSCSSAQYQFSTLSGTIVQMWSSQSYLVVSPTVTTTYMVEVVCPPNYTTYTDTFRVEVIYMPTLTGVNTLCEGDGTVITASGSTGDFGWWTDSLGGTQLDTTAVLTIPSLTNDTTVWVQANGYGAGGGAAVLITECATETPTNSDDYIEVANLYSVPVNTAGWVVAISDSYSNINDVNSNLWHLPNIMQPCEIDYRQDNSSYPNYWGNNIYWNPGNTYNSWAIIIDNVGNVVDFCVWGWTANEIANFNVTINGFPITLGPEWTGNGCSPACGAGAVTNSIQRTGNNDSNTLNDWTCQYCSQDVLNPGLSCGWVAVGCRWPFDITVNPSPILTTAAISDSICDGQTTDITVNSSVIPSDFLWSNGQTTQTITVNSSVPNQSEIYTVTVSANGCESVDSISIFTNPIPQISVFSEDDHCSQGIGYAWAESITPGVTFQWNTSPTQVGDTAYNLSPGSYTVTVSSQYCNNDTNVVVDNIPGPIAGFTTSSSQYYINESVIFTDLSINSTSWMWNFGDGGSSNNQNPTYTYPVVGNYIITQWVYDDFGCMDSTSKSVNIGGEFTIYIPNAFSPNDDGINDQFIIKGEYIDPDNFHLVIYSRWGDKVFETTDINILWDGKYDSNNNEWSNVFVYYLTVKDIFGGTHKYDGIVTLVH